VAVGADGRTTGSGGTRSGGSSSPTCRT